MSYTDLYFARKVSNLIGFGRKLWMFKLPRVATGPSGTILLGSLVEEVDRPLLAFERVEYPLPFSLTTPKIMLNRLEEVRSRINLSPSEPLVLSQTLASGTISATAGRDLDVEAGSNFLGIPISLSFGISNAKMAEIKISLNAGAEIQYIPTDYMTRFSSLFGGKDDVAFPNVAVDIDDHLFVDLILLAKDYSVTYKYSEEIGANIDAEIKEVNQQFGSKVQFQKTTDFSIEVKVKDDSPYVLAFKTIDWDDLDF